MGNESNRAEQLKKLPDHILNALGVSNERLQLKELQAALPEFTELSDEDWLSVLNDMYSDSLIEAQFIRTGIDNKIRTAFNITITQRGRQLTPELPAGRGNPINEANSLELVTVGGECFRAKLDSTEAATDRDGVYYLFKLDDLKRNRGRRLILLFRSGQDKTLRPNHDAIITNVRINMIRRAFDSGLLSFNVQVDEHKYQHLILRTEDFEPHLPVSDADLRNFISHKAYWLGYRYNPNPDPPFPIQFDTPADLDYLGVGSGVVRREMWLLTQKDLLEKVKEGFGRPTSTFIEVYEKSLIQLQARVTFRNSPKEDSADSRVVFLVHGHDEAMKQSVARFLEKLDLKPIILHEQPNKGRTIIEKFEAHSTEAGFAVVLLSPDDYGAARGEKSKPRARQNVILELGYFIGRLGRPRVCALYTGGLELPSDLHGVLWLSYDADWKLTLAKEIKEAGIDVDLNRA